MFQLLCAPVIQFLSCHRNVSRDDIADVDLDRRMHHKHLLRCSRCGAIGCGKTVLGQCQSAIWDLAEHGRASQPCGYT